MSIELNQATNEPIRLAWCSAIHLAYLDATRKKTFQCPSKTALYKLDRISAIRWIFSDDFETVCDCLEEINCEEIRDKVKRKIPTELQELCHQN